MAYQATRPRISPENVSFAPGPGVAVELQKHLDDRTLPERDRRFAEDLLRAYRNGGCTGPQWDWIGKLCARAQAAIQAKAGPAPQATLDNVSGIIDLVERARDKLNFPKLRFDVAFEGRYTTIKLNVAGAKARVPGSLTVVAEPEGQESHWIGRILRDGRIQVSKPYHSPAWMQAFTATLHALSADPIKFATAYGRRTGNCIFCDIELSDERSKHVGYGRKCAKNYNLPWGDRPTTPEF